MRLKPPLLLLVLLDPLHHPIVINDDPVLARGIVPVTEQRKSMPPCRKLVDESLLIALKVFNGRLEQIRVVTRVVVRLVVRLVVRVRRTPILPFGVAVIDTLV